MQILQSELLETKQVIQELNKEKELLKSQQQQLQDERDQFAEQKEKHIVHVTNSLLMDIWILGVDALAAYESVVEVGQEILETENKIKPYRNWHEGMEIKDIDKIWFHTFRKVTHKNIRARRQDMPLEDWLEIWKCSKDSSYVYEAFFEGPDIWEIEFQRRIAEYHVLCFDEFEKTVRQRIELLDGETVLKLGDFLEKLVQWSGTNHISKEVADQIRQKLTDETFINHQLANLVIQLRVPKGASLKEITEEAKRIKNNLKIAQGWLDKATSDRHVWATRMHTKTMAKPDGR